MVKLSQIKFTCLRARDIVTLISSKASTTSSLPRFVSTTPANPTPRTQLKQGDAYCHILYDVFKNSYQVTELLHMLRIYNSILNYYY